MYPPLVHYMPSNDSLYLYCFDGITYRNNKIEESTDYVYNRPEKNRFVIDHCDNVTIEE